MSLFAIVGFPLIGLILWFLRPSIGLVIMALLPLAVNELSFARLIPYAVELHGINIRYWDPLILSLCLATVTRWLCLPRTQSSKGLHFQYLGLNVFLIWSVIAIGRHFGPGVLSSLGEWRTYYGPFLAPLYIATLPRREILQAFRFIMWLSLILLPVLAAVRFTSGEGVTFGIQFLTAFGSYALLVAAVAMLHVRRIQAFYLSAGVLAYGNILLSLVTSHRSVWLSFLGMVFAWWNVAKLRSRLVLGLTVLIAVGGIGLFLGDFAFQRLIAFASPGEDDTVSWRLYIWGQAVENIRQNPVLGKGLGTHFEFLAPDGRITTTHPHNGYLTMAVQTGLIGLTLYLIYVAQAASQLLRGLRNRESEVEGILRSAFLTLVSLQYLYMGYAGVDLWLPWIIIGCGTALAASGQKGPSK